jgi:parallel beta-helix repeat protein
MKKTIALGVVFLLVVMSFTSISGVQINEIIDIQSDRGNILYVGGSGEGNYTTIQSAIDDALDGDTVFVYDDSSPYYEHLLIEKPLKLIGENQATCIIDGYKQGNVIHISSTNYVTITSFTITNGTYSEYYGSGIYLTNSNDCKILNNTIMYHNEGGITIPTECKNLTIIGNHILHNQRKGILNNIKSEKQFKNCIIKDNIITDCGFSGIWLDVPIDCQIIGNTISGNTQAIAFWYTGGWNTTVINNVLFDNEKGIQLYGFNAKKITIHNNLIYNNKYGIDLGGHKNYIYSNIISNNNIGILVEDAVNNKIEYNNFIDNEKDGYYTHNNYDYHERFTNVLTTNKWNRNYYNKWIYVFPKMIFGTYRYIIRYPWNDEIIWEHTFNWLPMVDWHPAKQPYNITTSQVCGIE